MVQVRAKKIVSEIIFFISPLFDESLSRFVFAVVLWKLEMRGTG